MPIVADIHFHYRRAIEATEAGAALQINPGNIGNVARVREVVRAARDHNCSMRIGVNAGSLEKDLLEKYGEPCPEALVESALEHAKILQDNDFHEFKISVKASDVFLTVAAYHQLAEAIDCPLHIGITEAGGLRAGTIKSAIGLGNLLWAGIGDTVRVSLSADPAEEVKTGYEMLKSLGLRRRRTVISCPSCARQQFDVIKTVQTIEDRLEHIDLPITVSIIGCVVNGPGEARETDIGLTGGGKGTRTKFICRVWPTIGCQTVILLSMLWSSLKRAWRQSKPLMRHRLKPKKAYKAHVAFTACAGYRRFVSRSHGQASSCD